MSKHLIIAMAAMLPLASMASIPLAERPTYRALDACEAAVESQLKGFEMKESYRQRQADGTQLIFANVLSDQGAMRVTCTTTAYGSRVLDIDSQPGRWTTPDRQRG